MAIDASIPLSVNPGAVAGPDFGRALTLADLTMKVRQNQQQMAGQNALRQIFSNPESVDATGNPTPQAMSKIMAVDPGTGMALRQNQLKTEQQRLALDATKTETYGKKLDLMNDEATKALSIYEDEMGKGVPETAARAKAQQAYSESRQGLAKSGLFSEQEIDRISPQFDPMKVRSFALSYKDRKELEEKQKAGVRADKREERMATHAERMEELAGKRIEQAAGRDPSETKWDVRQDKDGTEYRYNPATAKATTLTGEPYGIKGSAGKVGTAKDTAGAIDDDTASKMARQYLTGDTSVMSNIGRGAQAADNIAKVRRKIYEEADKQGMAPEQIAAKVAEFQGIKAGERTAGTRTAQVGMATNEAKMMVPLALEASEKVKRTDYPTLNSIILAADKGTGGEDVVRFGIATNSLINIYSRAISPTGVPTVSDKEHARELLATAWSKGQYKAGVDQLMKEMEAAGKAPGMVREEFRRAVTGGNSPVSDSVPKVEGQAAESIAVPPAYKDQKDGTVLYDAKGFAYAKKGDHLELMK